MLNYLWAGMIVVGIAVATITGRLPEVTAASLDSSREAITLCITMLGIMSMWTGLMKIAENSGLISALSRAMSPVMRALFPTVPKDSKAMNYMSTNIIANMLGLGWAATPAGLKAMEALQEINPRRDEASDPMCMFMIINMSSLQLVTMSVVAYRAQYGAVNPSDIIGPGLLATTLSTIVGVAYAKWREMAGRSHSAK